MPIILIDDDWRIDHDPRNWMLQQRKVAEETGKERWDTEGFYPSLPSAIKALVDKKIKVPADIKAIVNAIEDLNRKIDTLLADAETPLAVENNAPDDDLDDFLS
jgi:hypothetical protein